MATTTTNYGFTKPATTDPLDVTVLNGDLDTIDSTLHSFAVATNGVVYRVIYNFTTSAYPARPSGIAAGLVEYIGPTTPTDWLTYDTWVDIS